jgi:glutamate 5-kinase
MQTKIHAAQMCFEAGCDMVITNGSKPMDIYDIIDGKSVGTKFTEKL